MTDDINLTDQFPLETLFESAETMEEDQQASAPKTVDKNRRRAIIPSSHQPKQARIKNPSAPETDNSASDDETDFDAFILRNFELFSGRENVISWLDNTEAKFNQYHTSRDLRFTAVPLLVEGEAKRKYIRNRHAIKSFDDFYEFLLTHYDIENTIIPPIQSRPLSSSLHPSSVFQASSMQTKTLSFERHPSITQETFNLADHLAPRSLLRSTALVDIGTTGLTGVDPKMKSPMNLSQQTATSTTTLVDTSHVLRKAIIDNLIKSPKIFQGGKEDVKQWLEDLEHQFAIAQIPDAHKLDLISYSLKGEALRWYKNNKTIFVSWQVFVHELKDAFISPYYEELAFKKLESYTQGANQPIRGFYNEVLKLCAEADPTMSESTKLKNLLNKAKPTIQFEIRRKKPTTTKLFLEYAKEIEELFQLSHIDINTPYNSHLSTNHTSSTITSESTIAPQTASSTNPTSNQKSFKNNYNNHGNRNNFRSSRPQSFNSSSQRTQSSYPTNQSANTGHSSSNQPHHYSSQNQDLNQNQSSNHARPTFPQTHPQQHYANQISSDVDTAALEDQLPSLFSDFCPRCSQHGHQASACQSF